MNPVSYSLYWMANKCNMWIPIRPPFWVKKSMGNWKKRIEAQPWGMAFGGPDGLRWKKIYRGNTFVYRITYWVGNRGVVFVCDKRLRNRR